jgi:hypothetical protein
MRGRGTVTLSLGLPPCVVAVIVDARGCTGVVTPHPPPRVAVHHWGGWGQQRLCWNGQVADGVPEELPPRLRLRMHRVVAESLGCRLAVDSSPGVHRAQAVRCRRGGGLQGCGSHYRRKCTGCCQRLRFPAAFSEAHGSLGLRLRPPLLLPPPRMLSESTLYVVFLRDVLRVVIST